MTFYFKYLNWKRLRVIGIALFMIITALSTQYVEGWLDIILWVGTVFTALIALWRMIRQPFFRHIKVSHNGIHSASEDEYNFEWKKVQSVEISGAEILIFELKKGERIFIPLNMMNKSDSFKNCVRDHCRVNDIPLNIAINKTGILKTDLHLLFSKTVRRFLFWFGILLSCVIYFLDLTYADWFIIGCFIFLPISLFGLYQNYLIEYDQKSLLIFTGYYWLHGKFRAIEFEDLTRINLIEFIGQSGRYKQLELDEGSVKTHLIPLDIFSDYEDLLQCLDQHCSCKKTIGQSLVDGFTVSTGY